ncbi:MAG: GNAT family N-acetyltransferase [Burkholderiales bacterium]|nr:GNAT family N-acetyltransferase [Burkholderiales bacterium]
MDPASLRAAVEAAIAAAAPGTDVSRLAADRPLREQVDLDSLDWLNVVAALGERLGIAIPEADYGRLETLEAIVGYLAPRVEHPGSPTAPASAELPDARHLVHGTEVEVRPMRADDKPLEADFVRRLSSESRYGRFMATVRELSPAKLAYLTEVDQVRHVALVAVVDPGGTPAIVGVVRYVVDPAGRNCEFAIAIDDGWHHSGLAGILMGHLVEVARARGLEAMEGFVLAANSAMLHLAHQLGFASHHDPGDRDTVRVALDLRHR